MSKGKRCHLCVKINQEHRCLYDEDGDENENYELIMKYFDPKRLFRGKELELTTVCLSCWRQIYGFYNFQESIYMAQKNLLDNSKDIHILEIESPQEGKGNDFIEKQEINIKNEQEFLPEDGCVFNSENNYEPIEVATVSPNKEICGISEKNSTHLLPKPEIVDVYSNDDSSEEAAEDQDVPHMEDDSKPTTTEPELLLEDECDGNSKNNCQTISLPKLEITDVYSNDDSSGDDLSDEYDNDDSSCGNDDYIEKDDSMDIIPAKEHVEDIPAKHSQTRMINQSDDLIAKWMRNLQCELCSEKFITYTVLRQHFQDNHPLDKFYVTCCQQRFHRRYYLEDHIRHHFDPNAFKCGVCKKDFAGRYHIAKHIRSFHKQSETEVGKPLKSTRISCKDLDKLVAQWMPTLECLVCKKMSPTLQLLKMHFRQHHPQKQFQIVCCDRKLKGRRDIENHIRLHIENKMFKCDLCHKEFYGKKILNAHMRSHHSTEKEIKRKNVYQKKMGDVAMDQLMAHPDFADQAKLCLECVVCSEETSTYSLLRQHFQAKHSKVKFYLLCCNQKLGQRYRIEDHVRQHIDPNAFKCNLCNKKFKESRYLIAHISRHNDIDDEEGKPSSKNVQTDEAKTDKEIDDLIAQVRPTLECVVCKKVCNTLTLLQDHFREIHPQKQFQIECCQRMFKKRLEIEEHFLLHTNPDVFKCELCKTRYTNRKNFLRHMRGKHPSLDSE